MSAYTLLSRRKCSDYDSKWREHFYNTRTLNSFLPSPNLYVSLLAGGVGVVTRNCLRHCCGSGWRIACCWNLSASESSPGDWINSLIPPFEVVQLPRRVFSDVLLIVKFSSFKSGFQFRKEQEIARGQVTAAVLNLNKKFPGLFYDCYVVIVSSLWLINGFKVNLTALTMRDRQNTTAKMLKQYFR